MLWREACFVHIKKTVSFELMKFVCTYIIVVGLTIFLDFEDDLVKHLDTDSPVRQLFLASDPMW